MEAYALTPPAEIHGRIAKLQGRIREAGLDAAFIVQNPDLFYFAGSIQQGILIVPAEGEPVYFVRRVFERAVEESPLPEIVKIRSPKEVSAHFAGKGVSFGKVGFELDVLPVATFQRFQQIFPGASSEDVSPMVREIRAVKSPHEAALLRECGKKLSVLLSRAQGKILPGTTESALQASLQAEAIAGGHTGVTRMRAFNQDIGLGCVISGPDAAIPSFADIPTAGKGLGPYVPAGQGYRSIGRNEPVIVDLIWAQGGYLVDMARTYSIGPMPEKLEEAYHLSVEVLRSIEAGIRPGAVTGELYEAGMSLVARTRFGENFMGAPGYNTKFIGHGVGIEVDELPFIAKGMRNVLAPGMAFTLEPKFVFPGEGAVGIENTYLVTPDGFEKLTVLTEEVIRCGG
ncbi:MAG: aminopeptidase P family protein [Deltaproteobacteria bacterium]|nr:aminopeptidase P family protein [Deltaproteobacteria bacterium]